MKIKISEHEGALLARFIKDHVHEWALSNANAADADTAIRLLKRLRKLEQNHNQTARDQQLREQLEANGQQRIEDT